MSLFDHRNFLFRKGGASKPSPLSKVLQWLIGTSDGETITDKLQEEFVSPSAGIWDVNCLSFVDTTGAGITDSRIVGTETEVEFVGTVGDGPITFSAGKVNIPDNTILVEFKTDSNIWYVASSGEGSGVYDVNSNDFFATTEMVGGLEMKDYLEEL
jgi:hypothetical protein